MKNIHKLLRLFQDKLGMLALYCLFTVYLDIQQNCLEFQEIVYVAIIFMQLIPNFIVILNYSTGELSEQPLNTHLVHMNAFE